MLLYTVLVPEVEQGNEICVVTCDCLLLDVYVQLSSNLAVLVKIKPHTSLSRFSLYSADKGNPIKS